MNATEQGSSAWRFATPMAGMSEGEEAWMRQARQLIDEGQCFLAYDLCRAALEHHSESLQLRLLGALALLRSGAADEAMQLLQPVAARMESRAAQTRRLLNHLRDVLPSLLKKDEERLDDLAAIAVEVIQLGTSAHSLGEENQETLQLLAEIHLESWKARRNPEDLRRGRDAFRDYYRLSGDAEQGLNAATLSWFLDEQESAEGLARQLIQHYLEQTEEPTFQQLVIACEAHLILGERIAALELCQLAAGLEATPYPLVVATIQRWRFWQERGLPFPDGLIGLLKPPVLVIFSGQCLDRPGTLEPTFPAYLERVVKRKIQDQLESLDAAIGYCSATAGSDLLFIEAMLERNGEVHLFLPCAIEDFVAARVRHAGKRWERRFHTALKLASSITFVTEERLLGHEMLFRFNNQILDGMARLRADLLSTDPHLLLVWDGAAQPEAGSPGDVMDHWPDFGRLHLIELDQLRADTPLSASQDTAAPVAVGLERHEPERVVRAMLFADIVGFSKLDEASLPGLWRFLAVVNEGLQKECAVPDLVESWGDALYVVMQGARSMLDYALRVQEAFHQGDYARFGISRGLQIRIGLHAGPVYEGTHPLTGRRIVYGSHVSRAARLEPVTVPGQIYGSQQFVAMLMAEENAFRHEQRMTGAVYTPWFECAYLGTQALAKNYGKQPVYHLRTL